MKPQATSRHLKHTTELTLMAPMRTGFVEVADVMSYATRLRLVLGVLNEIRRVSIERDGVESAGPLERLRSLHDVRWALVNGDRTLLLAVTFDRSWEAYIQGIVDQAGPLLDLIFSHCEGYEGNECRRGYLGFARWVRKHQVNCDFFYAGSPDLTVDDARYFAQLSRRVDRNPAEIIVGDPSEGGTELNGYRALSALNDLKRWFPGDRMKAGSDRFLWDAAARATIPKLSRLDPGSLALESERTWLTELQNPPLRGLPQPKSFTESDVQALRTRVQANILTKAKAPTHGLIVLIRLKDAAAARALLEKARVTPDTLTETEPFVVNLGFTWPGVQRLNLPAQVLGEFPKEFREGMEARAGLLGDTGYNSPENWTLPAQNYPAGEGTGETFPMSSVDVVLILQGSPDPVAGDHVWGTHHPLKKQLAARLPRPAEGVEVLHVHALRRYDDNGHFGFADGTSQPVPDLPTFNANVPQRDRIPLGEFLLGYPNARDEVNSFGWFEDGSFLVIRKLEQNVAAFEDFAKDNAANLRVPEDQIASAILGRDRRTGRSLVSAPENGNDFDYENDRAGTRCPLHAHVRRANPRPADPDARALVPRIVRRGFSYGPRRETDSRDERGLIFMAYNSSIANQFEVVQRWINGANSTGTASAYVDLFSGTLPANPTAHWIHVGDEVQYLRPPREPLVTVRWGLYVFVPSLAVLDHLAKGTQPKKRSAVGSSVAPRSDDGTALSWGRELLAQLRLADNADAWKKVLEDVGMADVRRAVWAAIREHDEPVLRTAYGVLVSKAADVEAVLDDDGTTYSVEEYGKRMSQSLGLQHLGVNRHDSAYDRLAELPNKFAAQFDEATAYEETCKLAEAVLGPDARVVHVERLARTVLAKLIDKWFGLPAGDPSAHVDDFLANSKYVFQPHPSSTLEKLGQEAGERLSEAYSDLVASPPNASTGEFLASLPVSMSHDARATAVKSLASGFMAATYGTFLAAIDPWIETGKLWRLPKSREELRAELLRALLVKQGPVVLYRICKRPAILGGIEIKPRERVVLGIGSAAQDDPDSEFAWLFGGTYGEQSHACPAQPMALGVMLGLTSTILQQYNLRRLGRFVLGFEPRAKRPPKSPPPKIPKKPRGSNVKPLVQPAKPAARKNGNQKRRAVARNASANASVKPRSRRDRGSART